MARIITHNDFDGIISAALCRISLGLDDVFFTGPNAIERSEVSITADDIVCDLPYPLECGMWFDHHPGNLDAVRLRGIDPESIRGRFDEKRSCARVVFEYFTEKGFEFPEFMGETVSEADMIDSFDYRSVEEWRRETPGKLVDMSMKARIGSFADQLEYLGKLAVLAGEKPLEEILAGEEVAARVEGYREEEAGMLDLVRDSISFLDRDGGRELVVMDFTRHRKRPRVLRNLAYLVHPDALGTVTINSLFERGRKTNGLSVSVSLSMNLTGREHGKDMGEIMRSLNIGDGHAGAAAGTLYCSSKDEMLREKKRLLGEIWELWSSMPGPPAAEDQTGGPGMELGG